MQCWKPLLLGLLVQLAGNACFGAMSDTIQKATRLRESGEFTKAADLLSNNLQKQGLSDAERKALSWEFDQLKRIRQDFSLTEEQLWQEIVKSVASVSRQEFEAWLAEGRFEGREIDGVRYYTGTSVNNLYFRDPSLSSRRINPRDIARYKDFLKYCREIKKAAAQEKSPYVLPHRFKLTMTVTTDPGAAKPGETIRAWLPIPRKYPFQDGFKLLDSSAPVKYVADENSSIRSAYLEQPAAAGKTTVQIQYEYARRAVRFNLASDSPAAYEENDPVVQQFTRETAHVEFSDEIKELSKKIVGPRKDPVKKAKAIYDWIGKNIKYSYALEYSTIPNISEYCRKNEYGDCGQQALLFITLCRAQGIPARWQSGWVIFPRHKNIHDWSEIYLPKHGWVPVDPELGSSILRYATNLTPKERQEIHDFYFGGLDQYRMIANCEHSQELQPPKNTFRSDNVDFQRGELETGDRNIYFDQYSYKMEVQQLSP